MRQNKPQLILAIAGSLLIIAAVWAAWHFEPPTVEARDGSLHSRAHTTIAFEGNFSANGGVSMDGSLHLDTYGSLQSSFDDISLQFFRNDGSVIFGRCFGDLNDSRNLEVDVSTDEQPTYIVFSSPDMWTKTTINDFHVVYYYYDHIRYAVGWWSEPSELRLTSVADHRVKNENSPQSTLLSLRMVRIGELSSIRDPDMLPDDRVLSHHP